MTVRPGEGVVGRNYAYQTTSSVSLILKDKILNPFIATGAHGMMIDDFNGDNFDHTGLGFVGGGYMGFGRPAPVRSRRAPVPPGTPQMGRGSGKRRLRKPICAACGLATHGSSYSYKRLLSRSRSDLQGSGSAGR